MPREPRAPDADPRRALPSVERLASRLCAAEPKLPAWAVRDAVRTVLAGARRALAEGRPAPASLDEAVLAVARRLARPRPGRVVNATGVVLHTNLGRAPLASVAAEAAARAGAHYTDLELAAEARGRGNRLAALSELLVRLSGAEAALAVNNNAAALLLAANTLAAGREVVVSRGELVEIGGSFRLPDILAASGVTLVEVGTTNRTHLDDYRRAIGPRTGLLLKVHRSNFEQRGYVAEVGIRELGRLGREHGVPVLEDLGSGTLVDLRGHGLPEESWAPGRLAAGADCVCFSGDKLLGGPQAGILLGSRERIGAMRRNPLARALRLDKLAIAALDATLRLLLEGRAGELPVVRAMTEPADAVVVRARRLADRLGKRLPPDVALSVEPTRAPVGGGSLPGFELDSWAVVLRPRSDPEGLAHRLRHAEVPVLARVRDDAVLLDARTLLPDDEEAVERALSQAASR